MAGDEAILGGGRYATDAGYRAMLTQAKHWPERIWAIEGCQGIAPGINCQTAGIIVSAAESGSSHCAFWGPILMDDSTPHAAIESYGRIST